MSDFVTSVILGVIEGVTEFLPISSTAHLRIAQGLMGLPLDDRYWKMYAVVIQLGAVLCLPVYFYDRILKFIREFPREATTGRNWLNHPLSLVMIAFACTAIPAFLLKKAISKNLESLTIMAGSLVIGGAVMWAVDALCQRPRVQEMERVSVAQAIWIGLMQTLAAIFPGTSRSMVTIASGQLAGLSRGVALEFSFFVSMPTMAAATLYDLYKTIHPGHDSADLAPLHISSHQWLVLAIGFVVSFFVAWAVVAWFMHWVRKHGFVPFAIYRISFGVLILVLLRHTS